MSITKEKKALLVAAVKLAYEYYQDKETKDQYLNLLKWIKNVETVHCLKWINNDETNNDTTSTNRNHYYWI